MKRVKITGRENIINAVTGKRYDDEGLRALNGIKEAIVEVNEEDYDQFLENLGEDPAWNKYKVEVELF